MCVLASILGVNFVLGLCFYCVCLAFSASLAPLFAPIVAAITVYTWVLLVLTNLPL